MTIQTLGQGTGFKEVGNEQAPRRLIMDLHGLERQGKTHFSLTAPGPVAYMMLDVGGQDVLPKLRRKFPKKRIFVESYFCDIKPGMSTKEVEDIATPIWQRFTKDFETALTQFRTIIVDTATEGWELLRLAEFGKVGQVKAIHYGPVNAEFRRLLRIPYNSSCNVVFVHKMKRTYVGDSWNGKYERAGFSSTGYEVQIEARAFRDEDGWQLEVINCRQQPDLAGEIIPEPLCDFANLATMIYPDTRVADWE